MSCHVHVTNAFRNLTHIFSFAHSKMNRPENVLYNFDQNATTTTANSNDNIEGDFAGTTEKLALAMTNPMNLPPNNLPATDAQSDIIRRPSSKSVSHATATPTTATNQNDLPMPKRNLSSYNLFFQVERENIIKGEEGMNYTHENIARVALRHYQQGKTQLPRRKHRKTHGKISFAELARSVANRWKQLDPSIKEMFIYRTNIEKARYQAEIAEWADRKLRSKPPSPKRESQTEPFTLVDIFRPNVKVSSSGGVDGMNRLSGQSDAMLQPEYIMPHRVFPPTTSSQFEQSQQPATHGIADRSAMSDVNNATFTDAYSQFSPGMGMVDPNSIYDFSHRYRSTSANDFAAQMHQYPQLTLQPVPTTIAMTLQQQFDIMNERNGLSDHHAQSSAQGYPASFSMRSPSTMQEQMSTQWGEGFVSMPNESYMSNEDFQRSIQYQPTFGTLSNPSAGGTHMTGQGPMRHEAKADDNETIDLQSLFNRFDAN
jgi:HMG (high mobility group) box